MSAARVRIPPESLPAPGGRALFRWGERDIALFNVDGAIYAIDDSCPHAGGSLVLGGLQGRMVQCRAHGLRFDLATGCMPGGGLRVQTFSVEFEAEEAYVVAPD